MATVQNKGEFVQYTQLLSGTTGAWADVFTVPAGNKLIISAIHATAYQVEYRIKGLSAPSGKRLNQGSGASDIDARGAVFLPGQIIEMRKINAGDSRVYVYGELVIA